MITKEQILDAMSEAWSNDTLDDITAYFDAEDFKNYEGDAIDAENIVDFVYEEIFENGSFDFASNHVYYAEAMDYLKKVDVQLYRSFEALDSYGYSDLKNINSCVLANILDEYDAKNSFDENRDSLIDALEELNTVEE